MEKIMSSDKKHFVVTCMAVALPLSALRLKEIVTGFSAFPGKQVNAELAVGIGIYVVLEPLLIALVVTLCLRQMLRLLSGKYASREKM